MSDTMNDDAFDETPDLPGRESENEYLARLGERRRISRESHDAVQAIRDAEREHREYMRRRTPADIMREIEEQNRR